MKMFLSLLLVFLFIISFSMSAAAATPVTMGTYSHDCSIHGDVKACELVIVDAGGIDTRAINTCIACGSNNIKSGYSYYHTMYSSTRCEADKYRHNRCGSCGYVLYEQYHSTVVHKPGNSRTACPF